jgi:DNA-binding Lrp family transcriptional regulator
MVDRLSAIDRRLLAALEPGLAITPEPYADLAACAGISEAETLERLQALQDAGTISRLGVVVRHRALGYRANAMVVWDIPSDRLREAGRSLAALPYVTLCYRRPRRPPHWPYNLFCMIHGRDRGEVLEQIEKAAEACCLGAVSRDVLFSKRGFKQRGARYGAGKAVLDERGSAA